VTWFPHRLGHFRLCRPASGAAGQPQ